MKEKKKEYFCFRLFSFLCLTSRADEEDYINCRSKLLRSIFFLPTGVFFLHTGVSSVRRLDELLSTPLSFLIMYVCVYFFSVLHTTYFFLPTTKHIECEDNFLRVFL